MDVCPGLGAEDPGGAFPKFSLSTFPPRGEIIWKEEGYAVFIESHVSWHHCEEAKSITLISQMRKLRLEVEYVGQGLTPFLQSLILQAEGECARSELPFPHSTCIF